LSQQDPRAFSYCNTTAFGELRPFALILQTMVLVLRQFGW
jgi:hypothetical protein